MPKNRRQLIGSQQLIEKFEVAVLVKNSISITEINRTPTEEELRVPAMMENLTLQGATLKAVSFLYIRIGKTGRKVLMDEHPHIETFVIELADLMENCRPCFETRKNRTLDRHTFLSRKQKSCVSLHQFWNIFNGLAGECDFGHQTQNLVYDIFILNMSNKQVEEKLCTEPKDNTLDALQFAIAYEDGVKRQRTIGNPGTSVSVKEEPVFAGDTKYNCCCQILTFRQSQLER